MERNETLYFMIDVENPKESTKATRTMTEFNRIMGYKVNMQSVTVFLLTSNEELKIEI